MIHRMEGCRSLGRILRKGVIFTGKEIGKIMSGEYTHGVIPTPLEGGQTIVDPDIRRGQPSPTPPDDN